LVQVTCDAVLLLHVEDHKRERNEGKLRNKK